MFDNEHFVRFQKFYEPNKLADVQLSVIFETLKYSGMDNKGFTFSKRIKSFKYAFQGICQLIFHEHNAWIHSVAAIAVCIAGYFFEVSATEWIFLVLCIGLVLAAEAFNTAIEKIADFISPDYHETIKAVKDVAAAGVLLIAIAAAITGCIIFIPKIIIYFG